MSCRPPCDDRRRAPLAVRVVLRLFLGTSIALTSQSATAQVRREPDGAAAPASASESQRPHPAVVRVIVTLRDGSSQGSGTLVGTSKNAGLVVTNWHVVAGQSGPIVVVFPDGFQTAGRVVKADRDWDLAAIVVARPHGVTPVEVATRPPQIGDPLTIAGYGGGWYRGATGRCTGYVAPAANMPHEMVELSIPARSGDSGGPIFNQEGELAGVLFGAGKSTTTGSYCRRVAWFLASGLPSFDDGPAQENVATTPLGPLRNPRRRDEGGDTGWTRAPRPRDPAGPITPGYADDPNIPRPAPSAQQYASGRLLEGRTSAPAAGAPRSADSADSPNAESSPSEPLHLTDVVGTTPLEQVKSVLAAVGAVAVLWMLLRLMRSDAA